MHLPQSPTGWVAVVALFVTLAGGVIMLVSVVSGGGAVGWGSGLVAVGTLTGTVALLRRQTEGGRNPSN